MRRLQKYLVLEQLRNICDPDVLTAALNQVDKNIYYHQSFYQAVFREFFKLISCLFNKNAIS
jgi:hypothetical protein